MAPHPERLKLNQCDHCSKPYTHILSLVPADKKLITEGLIDDLETQRQQNQFIRLVFLCTDCTKEFLTWL